MNISLLSIVAVLAYLGAGFLVLRRLTTRVSTTERRLGGILVLAGIGLLAHSILLYQNFFATAGLNFGVFNALSLLAWLIVLLLAFSIFNRAVENLGIAVFPLAALTLIVEASFTTEHIVDSDNVALKIHILISILSSSIVTIAAIQALLLAVQDRHLHNKHPGGFVRTMPPLQTMEALLFQMLAVGFVLQSLSLVSGFAFLEDMFAQHLVHKTVLSILAWIIFAVLLWGRWRFGWRGKMAIRSTLSGFVLLMLAYIGSKLVLEVMIGKP